MIYLKSKAEIEKMKIPAEIMKKVLSAIKENIREGISTEELDKIAENVMVQNGAIPSFRGVECMYQGGKRFKNATCISVNEEIIHGIPSPVKILKKGDVVSVDVGVYKGGYHADAGRTYIVGEGSELAKKLVRVAEQAFFAGVDKAVVGNRIGDISYAIQQTVEQNGFSLLEDFQGHGIGKELHEDPGVPNIGNPGKGVRIQEGMTLAIEPMIVAGSPEVIVGPDKWVIKTKDRSLTAYYENTVAITKDGVEILTL
ncbi:MAG: type I methionyl aminopeptidase [Clostridia bacterium]|nr:type I methionyl aminopeptidase [Clostridia bacterium]